MKKYLYNDDRMGDLALFAEWSEEEMERIEKWLKSDSMNYISESDSGVIMAVEHGITERPVSDII